MLKLKLQYFGPLDAKSQLIGKDPDAGNDWGEEDMEATEDEMVGWHHRLKGPEFEQAPGDAGGWRSLVCYSLRGPKEMDTTEQLSNKKKGQCSGYTQK